MKKINKILSLLIALGLIIGIFSGCEKKESVGSDITKLKWYVCFQEQPDFDEVQEEINKILREKINAEIEIKRLDMAGYKEQIKLIISANEDYDLAFCSPMFGWDTFQKSGAFMPLDDLLKEYAPKSYGQIPEEYWNAARGDDGKIYCFLNYQIVARRGGFVAVKDDVEKTGFDFSTIKKASDVTPILAKLKEQNPDCIPIAVENSTARTYLRDNNIRGIDGTQICAMNFADNTNYNVFNLYETPEYEEKIAMIRDWYNKGYVDKDAATTSNLREKIGAGKIKIWYETGINPGIETSLKEIAGGKDVVTSILHPAMIEKSNINATMTCINANSKNPEKAMQFLEMLNTNEDNIYNILNFGIEGKHYNKVSENRIEQIENSGWNPNMAWEFGNQFNAYILPGQEDSVWEETKQLNKESAISPLYGFAFDDSNVKNEISNCEAITTEYCPALETGAVDYTKYLPEFIEKLRSAGSEKIIEEVQRQVDEWKAKK